MTGAADGRRLTGPVPPERLRVRIDPAALEHETSADFAPPEDFPGQERAHGAVRFGARIDHEGYNIFVLGSPGFGRREMLRSVMRAQAKALEPGPDWVYVNNFEVSHKPHALRLPHGMGVHLRDAMDQLVENLAVGLPAAFESDEYKSRLNALQSKGQSAHDERIGEIRERANAEGIALVRTPMGLAFAPMEDGEVVNPKTFNSWSEEERERVGKRIEAYQEELNRVMQQDMPGIERQVRDEIRELNRETARATITYEVGEVAKKFEEVETIRCYLETVEEDLVENFHLFLELAKAGEEVPLARKLEHPALRRYAVNVIDGADRRKDTAEEAAERKIVEEPDPTYANLVGRIEYQQMQGALITDFTMIKPGALHRANGGYLILDARRVLMQPFAWEALKRCLDTGRIRMASLADRMGLAATMSLEPDEIPLDVKVALVGDRMLYYLLSALDPDFAQLFKVEADFEDAIDRTEENVALMARLMAGIVQREGLRPFDRGAMAASLEEASRLADDAAKISLRVSALSDLLREADHWAREAGAEGVGAEHVKRAVEERRTRAGRLRERAVEMVSREIVDIATEGSAVGQINGLAVLSLGETRFGRPSRITARTRLGPGKIIDIEREVKLGGPIHSKGVLILSSFLATRYGGERPVSLWASLVFEQSYGGIDGDSASSAELYALLSSLAEAPIEQSFAVTGAVDQYGRVQAIGGVNEKIEGFYDVCKARGLTGAQGVLIPASNVQHLNLREDVAEAVEAGRFSVRAVDHIDQGIAILTGLDAGEPDANGTFPEGTVNARVAARLEELAEAAQRYGRAMGRGGAEGPGEETGGEDTGP